MMKRDVKQIHNASNPVEVPLSLSEVEELAFFPGKI
jgi:hypothetical protein